MIKLPITEEQLNEALERIKVVSDKAKRIEKLINITRTKFYESFTTLIELTTIQKQALLTEYNSLKTELLDAVNNLL
ncbi:MAG: hypothetical protein AB1467_06745 [Candidatus Diapherotrites archaeon]